MLKNLRRLVGLKPEAAEPAQQSVANGPRHIGIIMDGNGRWAVRRGLPRTAGHRAGVETVKDIVRACPDLGIETLTLYAFSTENWKRPKDEVDALMLLLVEYCRREAETLHKNGVKIRAIGRLHELPELQRQEIERATHLTHGNDRLVLNIAINYGGRAEVADAVRQIAARVAAGEVSPEQIDETTIDQYLYTAGQADPDLIIRTAGEMRLSNFLLWQAAYSEIWVTPVLWPEFRREHLQQALSDFGQRERRFGAVLQQSR